MSILLANTNSWFYSLYRKYKQKYDWLLSLFFTLSLSLGWGGVGGLGGGGAQSIRNGGGGVGGSLTLDSHEWVQVDYIIQRNINHITLRTTTKQKSSSHEIENQPQSECMRGRETG